MVHRFCSRKMSTLFWKLNPEAEPPPPDRILFTNPLLLYPLTKKSLALRKTMHIKDLSYVTDLMKLALLIKPAPPSQWGSGLHRTRSCPVSTLYKKLRIRAFLLTSPALLLVVLAEDAALGVGERCRVTRAMVGALLERREGKRRSAYLGRCSAIVSVTGEKMPSQSPIQQHLPLGRRFLWLPLPMPSAMVVLISGNQWCWKSPLVCTESTESEISSRSVDETNK